MGAQLVKDAIDLGIVVKDKDAALKFYRDTLGFEFVEETDMGRGTLMQRLNCGNTLIKLLTFAETPEASAPPGGIIGGTGYRYWTISVSNLEAVTDACREAGCAIPVSPTVVEFR